MRGIISALLLVSLLTTILKGSDGAKILGFFPWPARSHFILGSALLKGLAEKGHQVTMISPFPQTKPVKNYRDIVISNFREQVFSSDKSVNTSNVNMFEIRNEGFFGKLTHIYTAGVLMTDLSLGDENVKNLLKSGEKFDAVIVEVFMIEAAFMFGHHFGVPVIGSSALGTSEWTNSLVGNPSFSAYTPNIFLSYSDHMNFCERLINSIANVYSESYRNYIYLPKQEDIKNKYFPGSPPLKTVLESTSLILLNSHASLHYPRPMVPSIVEIGGFHVGTPKKLPEDLQKYLDEAPNGVIYFSMGSNLQSKDLPIAKREAFLKAFGKLKQKVLWKWEDDTLPNQPANVKLGKWLPQQDILAHPNVKLFITHGGLLSTTEAISRGVPLVGIPIFGDQHMNMQRSVKLGFAVLLQFHDITTDSVFSALNEVLTNPKYMENAKHRSAVLNDQQVTPMEKAVYWVEYVIRHKGAKHLRSAALDLHWTQIQLLDVTAVIALVLLGVVGFIYFVCKRLFCSKKCPKKIKQKTN